MAPFPGPYSSYDSEYNPQDPYCNGPIGPKLSNIRRITKVLSKRAKKTDQNGLHPENEKYQSKTVGESSINHASLHYLLCRKLKNGDVLHCCRRVLGKKTLGMDKLTNLSVTLTPNDSLLNADLKDSCYHLRLRLTDQEKLAFKVLRRVVHTGVLKVWAESCAEVLPQSDAPSGSTSMQPKTPHAHLH